MTGILPVMPLFTLTPGGAGQGALTVSANWPAGSPPVSFAVQAFVADPAAMNGIAISNPVWVSLD